MSPLASIRHSWSYKPAWAVLSERNEFGGAGSLLSLSAVFGVRERPEGEGRAASEDLSGYRRVVPGDFVVNRLVARDGAFAVSGLDGLISPAYWVLRARKDFDTRFVNYLFRSSHYLAEIGARSKAMPPAQFDLPWEQFRTLPIASPELSLQRDIADYLDTETARIDALISKKLQIIELIDERRSAFVGLAVTVGVAAGPTTQTGNEFAPLVRSGWALHRLRHVVKEIVDTAHKTAPVVDDGEYLVVRTANVKAGELVLDGARYTDEDGWREWTARGVPSVGDVIFTREAPAGEACLVPEDTALCIGQRTVLLRPNRSMIFGEWIMHSIYSGAAQRFIEVLAKSTTVAHINMSDIPDLPIVLPPIQEQEAVLALVRQEVSRISTMKEKLTRQIGLLRDHRQALITAAVTGEMEIPEVAA